MVRIIFLTAQNETPSFKEQAIRPSNKLEECYEEIQTNVVKFPSFSEKEEIETEDLIGNPDYLIVVKPTLIKNFPSFRKELINYCRENDIITISNPVDGSMEYPVDIFSIFYSDYVISISKEQYKYVSTWRKEKNIIFVGNAPRKNLGVQIRYRDVPRKVIWENPVHYRPTFPDELKEPYKRLENLLEKECLKRECEFEPWLSYGTEVDKWTKKMLSADIAIECKALRENYSIQQRLKPPTKVQNYMSVGLPVICDPIPSYKNLGKNGEHLLLADKISRWKENIQVLLENENMRKEIGRAARKKVLNYTIKDVVEKYVKGIPGLKK